MKSKSTHMGTCQICGHVQKLPAGGMALHGYTKRWGFFSGVCHGSRNLPFEQSCDLIQAAVASVRADILRAEEEILALQRYEGDEAWVSVYVPATWQNRTRGHYEQKRVKLIETVEDLPRGDGTTCQYRTYRWADDTGKSVKVDLSYPQNQSLRAAVAHLNHQHRVCPLQRQIAEMNKYVMWQQERVAQWKPTELIPVKGVL